MAFPETKTAKTVATITLLSFFWVYLGLGEIAIAGNASTEFGVHSSKEKAKNGEWHTAKRRGEVSSPAFEDVLERMRKAEESIQDKIQKNEDIDKEEQEIAKEEAGIEQRDAGIKKRFRETEEKIKNLPDEIKQRHKDFVEKYEENLKILRTNLQDIKKARTKAEKHEAHRKAKDFLEKIRPPTRHTPLDPNKLPHRAEEHKELKKPRLKKEQFERDLSPQRAQREEEIQETELRRQGKDSAQQIAFSGQQSAFGGTTLSASPTLKKGGTGGFYNNDPILVAANGSLDGLITQNSKLSTENYPLLALADPPTDADLAETIEVQFTPEIRQLAADLGNSPVKIFNHIRNHFEYEPYAGSLKGAAQTLLERAGNDFDQASLLIALLRVSNIPARYVYGTIEMPIEKFMNWMGGITDINTAVQILATAGVPGQTLSEGGQIRYVQFEHVWVEAYVSYIQSRGALGGEGDMWIEMDPSFKDQNASVAEEIEIPAFDQMEYLSAIKQDDPVVSHDEIIQAYLTAILPDRTTGAVKLKKEIEPLWFDFLLGTLPYDTIASTVFSDIPNNYRHAVSISVTDEDIRIFGSPLTYSMTTAELAGKRLSLSYGPATASDESLINQYGDMYKVPAYLLKVKPEVRVNGELVREGSSVGFGKEQTYSITFKAPGGKNDSVNNVVVAGGYYVTVLNLQKVSEHQVLVRTDVFRKLDDILQTGGTVPIDDYAGEILYLTGLAYFQKIDMANRDAAELLKIVDVKGISEAIIALDPTVDYSFGAPVSVTLSSISIDVDRDIHAPIPIDGDTNKMKEYMVLTGSTSSFYEHKTLEEIFETECVSAIKIIQTANERGIPVYTINSSNSATLLNALQISNEVKMNIANATNAGKEVIVPQQELQINDWVGTGYIVTNPKTGSAAYMISGGLAGGMLSVWSLNIPYSYNIPANALADNTSDALTPKKVRFPGIDDMLYTTKDVVYPMVNLLKFPLMERTLYFYDPHPERGDSELIKIDETNENDWISSFAQLKNFRSKDDARPYMRLHPSIVFTIYLIKFYLRASTVSITSGYRNRLHNLNEKGKPKSYHMDGLAADIRVTINGQTTGNPDVYELLKEAAMMLVYHNRLGGVGCYPSGNGNFIHVDTSGKIRKWGRGCK